MVCAFVNMMGLYTGGLIFGVVIWWAYARGGAYSFFLFFLFFL